MSSTTRLWLFTLTTFIICLFLTIPAKTSLPWLDLDNDITVHGVSGRLLNGKADRVSFQSITLSEVSWNWSPIKLLEGKTTINWTLTDPELSGSGVANYTFTGQQQISSSSIQLSLEKVQDWLTSLFPATFELRGNAMAEIDHIYFDTEIRSIDASVAIENVSYTASNASSVSLPLAHIRVYGNDEEAIILTLKDNEQTPKLDLTATLINGNVKLSGVIDAGFAINDELNAYLPFIARKQGNKWQVNWEGKLSQIMPRKMF